VKRRIVPCVLVASLLFSIGCYNTEMVTKEGLKARAEQVDITVFTSDSLEYKFLKTDYSIQGDTVSGFGIRRRNTVATVVLDASLPLASITSIETRELDPTKTILLCGGVVVGVALIILILSSDNQQDQPTPQLEGGHPL